MGKSTNIITGSVQLIALVTCVALMGIALLFSASLSEAVVRNLAFINLSRFLFQPTLTLDRPLARSLRLFEQASSYNPVRYVPYRLRLKGLAGAFGGDNCRNDEGKHLPAAMHASVDEQWTSQVKLYLDTIVHDPLELRKEAVQQLIILLDTYRESKDFGRYVYTDVDTPLSFFPVAFDQCPALELVAIYFSECHIALRQSVPVVLVWHMTAETSWEQVTSIAPYQLNHRWEVYRDGDYLIQIGNVSNQLFDGGFEQTVLPREGQPSLLPVALYSRQTQQHTRLLYEIPESGQNMILELYGKGETSVGLGSSSLEIPAEFVGQAYLVTGRYRTDGEAVPRIGVRWLLKSAKEWDENVSSYIVRTATDEWISFAGILLPHPDAESFQYWALNANPNSRLYVDNLGVFPISLPCMPK
ncbi:MAG: hypothetical protein QXP01_04150 [Candidatus Hadarchaeum sp.]